MSQIERIEGKIGTEPAAGCRSAKQPAASGQELRFALLLERAKAQKIIEVTALQHDYTRVSCCRRRRDDRMRQTDVACWPISRRGVEYLKLGAARKCAGLSPLLLTLPVTMFALR
jgi:hypothetical protein